MAESYDIVPHTLALLAMLHRRKVSIFILGLTESSTQLGEGLWCFGLSGWLYSKLS